MAACLAAAAPARGLDRTIDGTGNHPTLSTLGAANTQLIRRGYFPTYANGFGAMISDAQRTNARTLSNALAAQTTSTPSARGLSNYIWAWGQFLDHDISLSTTSQGAGVNGSFPIATGAGDPLGPGAIAFTRSNFVLDGAREQVNEVTAYIDGSQIYGSSPARAAALRTDGGAGAKLLTSAGNLLPFNTAGLPNQNNGPTPANQLFLAGDIRANENLLLTSLQTVFMREHNRLVDLIQVQQPGLNAEQQYQLARKIVGAELQAITYKEFLPALLGPGSPTVQAYRYDQGEEASITNSFSHAAFRFGHSSITSSVALVDAGGVQTGSMSLASISSAPNQLANNPGLVDQLLRGAAIQVSEEIDLKHVSAVRNILFGPPGSGAGGTDLAAVDIQRGRDHGLPDYNTLRESYGLAKVTAFSQITSDAAVQQALSSAYGGNINNIDPFVGGLAETHVTGSSLGPLFHAIIQQQFLRTRDADRLFYRNNLAGLYTGGVLNSSIASLVNLNTVTLADVIEANTGITGLSDALFYVSVPGDFNHDGYVNSGDLATWRLAFNAGTMNGNDFSLWQRNLGTVAPWAAAAGASLASVPEPSTLVIAAMLACVAAWRKSA
ncbi:MAG TPA: peroxidase family protein [Lacipirellulaceae bacterium]|nr:peroxidase family protein [Lacipirellulaceae bacterium]